MTRATRFCWPLAALLCMPFSVVLCTSSSSAGENSLVYVSGLRPVVLKPETQAQEKSVGRPGILFVVEGAGGFERSSRTVRQTIGESDVPLEVRSFYWTHGYCRIVSDEMHSSHLRKEGRMLADMVLSCRQEKPDQAIFLMGHSAGCGVVLNAAENLPPSTVTRIVLLAPAVSSKRDLRGALRSSCHGIDVFISSDDWACLGLGMLLLGTTDRCWTARAAGKNGFQPIITCPEDASLYAKLRHYPWEPSFEWTGHKGGHYGCYQPGFLRLFVLPLLTGERPVSAGWTASPAG